MSILVDPLFSDEARGTVGQVLTFKRAIGFFTVHPQAVQFCEHPITWTPAKRAQALWWRQLCSQWRSLPLADQAYWGVLAPGVLTGFNYFMQCKGEFPWLPPYDPPSGGSLYFNFVIDDYDPPAGGALVFHFALP